MSSEVLLVEELGLVYNSHLQKSLVYVLRVEVDMESKWSMFCVATAKANIAAPRVMGLCVCVCLCLSWGNTFHSLFS